MGERIDGIGNKIDSIIDTFGEWYVNRLEDRSNANGRNDLDGDLGRFLGITHLVTGHFLFFSFLYLSPPCCRMIL